MLGLLQTGELTVESGAAIGGAFGASGILMFWAMRVIERVLDRRRGDGDRTQDRMISELRELTLDARRECQSCADWREEQTKVRSHWSDRFHAILDGQQKILGRIEVEQVRAASRDREVVGILSAIRDELRSGRADRQPAGGAGGG